MFRKKRHGYLSPYTITVLIFVLTTLFYFKNTTILNAANNFKGRLVSDLPKDKTDYILIAAAEDDKVEGEKEAQAVKKQRKKLKIITTPTMAVGRKARDESIGEVDLIVEENVEYKPAPLQKNKELEDRGDLEAEDLVGEDEEYQSLIDIEADINPDNPIFLSRSGKLAGTGNTSIRLASGAARVGAELHPKALEAEGVTFDEFGLVNWADAIRKGVISPIAGLTPAKKAAENYEEYIILFKSKSDYMADVIFPHDIHTYWLDCSNCHRKIFIDKAGANPVTMKKIVAGYYCGRCHGKVAFPLEECTRCHVKPKGGGAIVPYPIFEQAPTIK